MSIKLKSRIVVFILSFLVWVALTSIRDLQEVVAGIFIALIVSLLAGGFFIQEKSRGRLLKRIFYGVIYIFKFLWEMFKANLHVAYIVINPKLPIKPGIVKIKSKLSKDTGLTALSNSITLTPGTLTVDINKEKGELYIHWIDVASPDVDEATKEIGGRFEKILLEVFE
ncbi:MAG: Na+/H+ antiporter subunit E [Candidatus Marinimicrobia bacterium]|nr:Na+/H+ antiporter subunit E [Candidatus Neomarinimicrobiota bacterium]